jgi:hypothetical protein
MILFWTKQGRAVHFREYIKSKPDIYIGFAPDLHWQCIYPRFIDACHRMKKNGPRQKYPKMRSQCTGKNSLKNPCLKNATQIESFLTRMHKANLPGKAAATSLLCRTCVALFPDWSTVRRTSQWQSFIRHPCRCT